MTSHRHSRGPSHGQTTLDVIMHTVSRVRAHSDNVQPAADFISLYGRLLRYENLEKIVILRNAPSRS